MMATHNEFQIEGATSFLIPNLRSWSKETVKTPWLSGSARSGGGATSIAVGGREKELSSSTRAVLKSMMRASRLSDSQQRFLDLLLRGGRRLIFVAHDGSTLTVDIQDGRPLPADTAAGMSFCVPSRRVSAANLDSKLPVPAHRPPIYGRRPAIRTLDRIAQTDAFKVEPYRPKPQKNYMVEKERFQMMMATNGADISPAAEKNLDSTASPLYKRRCGQSSSPEASEADLDEFDIVTSEIEERRQWLDDMIALGHGNKYKRQIQSEISQRVARLQEIDRERTSSIMNISTSSA